MRWLVTRLIFFPTLLWNMLLGRWLGVRQWWNRIDAHIILGAFPFASDVKRLKSEGVTGVVNTCEEYQGPRRQYEQENIEQLHIPTLDFTPPSLEDIERAVAFIGKHVQRDGTVYIHCKAGRARSATVAVCWYIFSQNLSPVDASRLLLEKRPHINQHLPQRRVVREFWEKHKASQEKTGS